MPADRGIPLLQLQWGGAILTDRGGMLTSRTETEIFLHFVFKF